MIELVHFVLGSEVKEVSIYLFRLLSGQTGLCHFLITPAATEVVSPPESPFTDKAYPGVGTDHYQTTSTFESSAGMVGKFDPLWLLALAFETVVGTYLQTPKINCEKQVRGHPI